MNNKPIIVALDYDNMVSAINLAERLDPNLCRVKVGKELFTSAGPMVVESLQNLGFEVFLDLKFHDIPNTVAKVVKTAANLGVWMVNIHCSGGERMMSAAAEAIANHHHKPILTGVTILTSMTDSDISPVGFSGTTYENAVRLAGLAVHCGLDTIVCSARDISHMKDDGLDKLLNFVTPGIRPTGSDKADQRRTVTPKDAILLGSDYMVIGRPITQADDPIAASEAIQLEISQVS